MLLSQHVGARERGGKKLLQTEFIEDHGGYMERGKDEQYRT